MKYRDPHALPARRRKGGPHVGRRRVQTSGEAIAEQAPARVRVPIPVGRVVDRDGMYQPLEAGTARVEGADGWPLVVGQKVKRPRYDHPDYGYVSADQGWIVAIYSWSDAPERVLVDYRAQNGGLHTTTPDRCRAMRAEESFEERLRRAVEEAEESGG